MDDSDVEAPREETEKEENERKMKEEDEKTAAKEKQDFAESIHVTVAVIVILGLAVAVVFFKLEYFPDTHVSTFEPLLQQVQEKYKEYQQIQTLAPFGSILTTNNK